MDRREFLAAGVGSAVGLPTLLDSAPTGPQGQESVRALFPRLRDETYLNAAGGTPLGSFAQDGLHRYMDFQRLGPGDGREEYVQEMWSSVRGFIGDLIGARPSEVALVHCTKAGEQIVIDGLDPMRRGQNIVTNDLHFSGSLHNLVGLDKAGAHVRIVRSRNWDVSLEDMAAAIDDDTALVTVTLLSNVNGRIEPMRELAEIAHGHGAFIYADIMQAAGIMPLDMRELGIDFAACNGYKWLFGVHGSGFLYVREEHQGTVLPDRLFPGHVRHNYAPWVGNPDPELEAFTYAAAVDARRYEPGHVSYLGYCGVYEGLKFLQQVGVRPALEHAIRLNGLLLDRLDPDRYESISPHTDRSPILTLMVNEDETDVERRLRAAGVVVTVDGRRIRVSPAVYNSIDDIDRLADALD